MNGALFPRFGAQELGVLGLLNDGLEGLGVVHSQVGENLAVDLDTCLVNHTHKFAVREVLLACGSVDTLNPQSAEVAFFLLTVGVCIGETLLPSVLGDGPDVLAGAEITPCKFQNSLALGARGYVIY